MPKKLFGQTVAYLIAEFHQDSVVVQRAHRSSTLVRAAQIQHKAARGLKESQRGFAEPNQPLDILSLRFVSVALLTEEGKRWTCNDEVNRIARQPGKDIAA